MSWKAVKTATFCDGVAAITSLSVSSLGSGLSFKLSNCTDMDARVSRSFCKSIKN